jgi:inner membrane protein
VTPDRRLATPTPFNTLLWRVVALDGDRYLNVYVPLLGREAEVYAHRRLTGHDGCLAGLDAVARLAAFGRGFYRVDLEDKEVVVSDLRMGLTPNYVFRFAVAEVADDGLRPIPPRRRPVVRRAEGDWDWLLAGVAGHGGVRLAEAAVGGASRLAQGPAAGPHLAC